MASTSVPTWFMRWFNLNSTTLTAYGYATRRDVVMMMIMDRSGSMNSNNGCSNMRAAAKEFTGQFAAGRDRIGMVEFGDTSWIDSDPTQNFQTVLGYQNALGSGAGLIDTITCNDNTGSAQAIAGRALRTAATAVNWPSIMASRMSDGSQTSISEYLGLARSVSIKPVIPMNRLSLHSTAVRCD